MILITARLHKAWQQENPLLPLIITQPHAPARNNATSAHHPPDSSPNSSSTSKLQTSSGDLLKYAAPPTATASRPLPTPSETS
eukprot:6194722-Amphidinium_carterae.1